MKHESCDHKNPSIYIIWLLEGRFWARNSGWHSLLIVHAKAFSIWLRMASKFDNMNREKHGMNFIRLQEQKVTPLTWVIVTWLTWLVKAFHLLHEINSIHNFVWLVCRGHRHFVAHRFLLWHQQQKLMNSKWMNTQ